MLLNNQINPLQIEIKQSSMLKCFIISTHGLAIIACMVNALPIWVRIFLIVVVMLHVLLMWRRYFRDQPNVKLLYTQSKGWEFEDKTGVNTIQILPSTVITTLVIILHFKILSGEKQSILILRDALLTEAFRELTVALKLY